MTHYPSLFDNARPHQTMFDFAQREAHRIWPNSVEHRKRSLAQLSAFLKFNDNPNRPMSHFLPKDVHAFSDHLTALGKANGTVNRYLATISSVFNHAVDEQIITHAPKLKFLPEEEGRIRYFSKEEQKNVIAYFESLDLWWMRDMFRLALLTGCRKGEIVALGEGGATLSDDGMWLILPKAVTKTSKARNVPLGNPDARAAAQRLQRGLGAAYSKRKFEQAWAKVQRDVGRGDKSFVFHVTRHTAASFLANDLQQPTVIVAEYLGHSDLATTQKYVHAKPDNLLAISAQM